MNDLVVANLVRNFVSGDRTLNVLRGVDFELARGDAVAVTGPSGSGKSTLLYIIGTLDVPTSGTVRVLNQNPFELTTAALAKYRNENIGFVFQDHHLLPQCTVLDNVLIPTLAGNGAGETEAARARALLDRVGLGERMSHLPAQISGGERQRVAVCRALINQPGLLLADEPTGNLDRETAESVGDLLLEVASEQSTMLICVTHSEELASRFPRRVHLRDGLLIGPGNG